MSIYEITAQGICGRMVCLKKFKGKVLLILNAATHSAAASSTYQDLNNLCEKYQNEGLEILVFPCNQFQGQAPGTVEEIKEIFCSTFKAKFLLFCKVDVNGPNTAPIFQFLKQSGEEPIRWNFTKFLVNRDGDVVERYLPTVLPYKIEKDIQELLKLPPLKLSTAETMIPRPLQPPPNLSQFDDD